MLGDTLLHVRLRSQAGRVSSQTSRRQQRCHFQAEIVRYGTDVVKVVYDHELGVSTAT